MKNQMTVWFAFTLSFAAVAELSAAVQTNDDQQKALELLHRIEGRPGKSPSNNTAPATTGLREPTFAEAEQLYLQGKITAKEFQQFLEGHKLDPAKLASPSSQTQAVEVLRRELNKAEASRGKSAEPTSKPEALSGSAKQNTDASPPAEQSGLSELEQKMDELLRLKSAREKAANATNAVSNISTNAVAAPQGPKTKRQRLDELLKLYIDGKIAGAEYNEKRGKLIADPN